MPAQTWRTHDPLDRRCTRCIRPRLLRRPRRRGQARRQARRRVAQGRGERGEGREEGEEGREEGAQEAREAREGREGREEVVLSSPQRRSIQEAPALFLRGGLFFRRWGDSPQKTRHGAC